MGCCQSENRQMRTNNKQPNNNGTNEPPGKPERSQFIKGNRGRKKIIYPREYLLPYVDFQDDFLTHHLKYELTLTKLTSMKRIRRRQIIEHLWLQTLWGNIGGLNELKINCQTYQQSLISAWIQRTFIDIWQQAHEDMFVKQQTVKLVRRKVAEQFMFQMYELKEYVDSGMANINFMLDQTRTQLNVYVQASDEALYNLFKQLKQRYPQAEVTGNIKVPEVVTTTTNVNLLDHFQNKCFSDPDNLNYQTIYEDINFLLKKAVEEQEVFQSDMKALLGDDVASCAKVGQVTKDGKTYFNACPVRRVFVKWAQNLLQKCPDLKTTKTFMKFIKAKSEIVNNFFFKSTIRPTTHKAVIDCLSLLIQLAKYDTKTRKKRPQFTFNIYDLLRCKVKRKTPQEVVALFRKLQKISTTKSGKMFKVIRVKNRFDTNNKDLLVNFRYGNILVGQAQLGLENAQVELPKQTKLNHSVSHFIYELERSIFGPTLQLMMQYEDFQRPDITVTFEAQGEVRPRTDEVIKSSSRTDRKCLQGHEMISLLGNYFIRGQNDQNSQQQHKLGIISLCNYCDRSSTLQTAYDYCYQCGCFLCKQCRKEYSKADTSKFMINVQREELLPEIKSYNELASLCQNYKSLIVLFWLEGSSASILFKDAMILHQAKLEMQPKKYIPKIVQIKYSDSPQFKDLVSRFNLSRYPTLVLFDKQVQPFKTVIGFSWFQTPNLYAIQQIIVEGKSMEDIGIYCTKCQERMEAQPLTNQSPCINCFGTSKDTFVPQEVVGYGAYCSGGHFKCMNCCYAALNCPTTYKDFSGGNYLSSSFVSHHHQALKCEKGHKIELSKKDPIDIWEYSCWKCGEKRYFDNQHGVGECKQCKSYLCPRCIGAKVPTLQQTQSDVHLVSHYVESSAQQIPFCLCQRPFKKVYTTRILSLQQQQALQKDSWQCCICERKKQNNELHIACFSCPFDKEDKMNIQICMRCLNRSKMNQIQPYQKVDEEKCFVNCPKDNTQLLYTSRMKDNRLTFHCIYCKKKYFGYTERFYCNTCNTNCCEDCKQNLWKNAPPICQQKCRQGHDLVFKVLNKKGIQFCDGCFHLLKDEVFMCEDDEYMLCTDCVNQKAANFIGDAEQLAKSDKEPGQEEDNNLLANYLGTFQGYDTKKKKKAPVEEKPQGTQQEPSEEPSEEYQSEQEQSESDWDDDYDDQDEED